MPNDIKWGGAAVEKLRKTNIEDVAELTEVTQVTYLSSYLPTNWAFKREIAELTY